MNRVRLVLSSLLVGAVASLALGACAAAPALAPTAQPVPVALAPAPPVLAPPVAVPPAVTTARPTTTAKRPTKTVRKKSRYTCEPSANAKVDPDTGVIMNKSCPDLNAKKERAQREYAEQQQASARQSAREQRDANGETYAEYCARTGQSVNSCNAG